MELKDLELEAVKIESFKQGYMAALNLMAKKLQEETKQETKEEATA